MCKFFSCVSDGNGKIYYLNAKQRKETKNTYESPDSHASIADYYGFKGYKEDQLNKYEFNPLTKEFTIDQINTEDDIEIIKQQCLKLDFKAIVPELIIKPIIHPFLDKKCTKVTEEDIKLLKQWASVRTSVMASVRDSVWDSVDASVSESVWDSVWGLVGASVRDSIGGSVWDSVWDYISSFFTKFKYDFTPLTKLWEKGLVPSLDGKKWKLHGYEGKILWEDTKGETK